MADDKPIIVVKKKGHHGGHHGGAWKVAYADFVTAMMAFFMVMWLLGQADTPTRRAIASYFRKPGIFDHASPEVLDFGGAGILPDSYQPPRIKDASANEKWEVRQRLPTLKEEIEEELRRGSRFKRLAKEKPTDPNDPKAPLIPVPPEKRGASIRPVPANDRESPIGSYENEFNAAAKFEGHKKVMEAVGEEIRKKIILSPELKNLLGDIKVKVEDDGIQLEIMDTEETSMFASGSAKMLPRTAESFQKLATFIEPIPSTIEILGHTDAKPFTSNRSVFTNWELSTMRANEARRVLENSNIAPERFVGVVGKAATQLKDTQDPFGAKNRRISLKLRFDREKIDEILSNPETRRNLAEKLGVPLEQLEPPQPTPAPETESSSGDTPQLTPAPEETSAAVLTPQAIPLPATPVSETKSGDDPQKSAEKDGLTVVLPTPTPSPTPYVETIKTEFAKTPEGIIQRLKKLKPIPVPGEPNSLLNPDATTPEATRDAKDIFEQFPVLGPETASLLGR